MLAGFALYWKNQSIAHWPAPLKYGLQILRTLSVFLIIVLLLGPLLKTVSQESEKPVVILGIDNSSSLVLTKDSTAVKNEFQSKLDLFITKIAEKYEVNPFQYGGSVTKGSKMTFDEAKTDLAGLLTELDDRFVGRNVGATVIIGDGIVNRGANPDYHKRRVSGPLYAVALGDTSLQRDQLIAKLDHNQYAYLGNKFPVEVHVEAFQMDSRESELEVLINGRSAHKVKIPIAGNEFRKKIALELDAQELGVLRISSSLRILDGELSTQNNRKDIFVEVLDGRQRVMILAASPHPDVAAIRKAIQGNQNYEVEVLVAGQGKFDVNDFDLIVLHQIPQKNRVGEEDLGKIIESNVPIWSIVGMQSDLSRLAGLNFGVTIRSNGKSSNETLPIIDSKFPLFRIDAGIPRLMSIVPPLVTHFAEYTLSASIRALMSQRVGAVQTEDPLWIFSEQSGRKYSVLLGTGLWRWRMRDYQENTSQVLFDQLVSKTVQYMAAKTDKSLFRVSVPNTIAEDDALTIEVELYNESYELVNEPEVNFKVRKADGTEYPFVMSRTELAYRLNAGSFNEGDYTYSARTSFNGISFEKSGSFRVAALRLESARTRADHGLLFRLADKNGGKMVSSDQMDELADEILGRTDIRNLIYERTWFKDVIDLKWIFAVLIALLGAEWFLRKRNGAY